MTDLLDLQLTMDARQFVAGGKAASSALDDISKKTQQASDSSLRFEGNVGRLYSRGGALGGVLQVSQGVGNLTTQLARGSVEAAAFGAAFLAMEVGKTAQDFHEMTDAVQGNARVVQVATVEYDALGVAMTRTSTVAATTAATGMQKFLFVLRANPLLTAVTALTAVATVISLIGSNSSKSAQQLKQLGDEGDAIANRRKTAGGFSQQQALSLLQQEQGRLPGLAATITADGKPISAGEMARLLGITVEQVASKLEQFGIGRIGPNGNSDRFLRLFSNDPGVRVAYGTSTDETQGGGAGPVFERNRQESFASSVGRNVQFSPDAAAKFLESEYKRLEELIKPPSPADKLPAYEGTGYGLGDFGISRSSLEYLNPVHQRERDWVKEQEKEQQLIEQRMERLNELANDFGSSLTSAFAQGAESSEKISDTMKAMMRNFLMARVQAGLGMFAQGLGKSVLGGGSPSAGQTQMQRFTPGPSSIPEY